MLRNPLVTSKRDEDRCAAVEKECQGARILTITALGFRRSRKINAGDGGRVPVHRNTVPLSDGFTGIEIEGADNRVIAHSRPSSATAATGRADGNRAGPPPFASAQGQVARW